LVPAAAADAAAAAIMIISLPFSLGCARHALLPPPPLPVCCSFFIVRSVDDGGEDELRPCFSMESMPESVLLLLLVAAPALSFSDVEAVEDEAVELLYAAAEAVVVGGCCEDDLGDGLEEEESRAAMMSVNPAPPESLDCLSALPPPPLKPIADLPLRMDFGLCAADGVCGPARFGSNLAGWAGGASMKP